MSHRYFRPPTQALTPVHTIDGVVMDLGFAQGAPDGYDFTDWFAGSPQQTIRQRTEEWVPAAYAEVWALNRQFEVSS